MTMRTQPLNPDVGPVTRVVYVCPPPETVPMPLLASHVASLTTMTSPLDGVKDGVTRLVVSTPAE